MNKETRERLKRQAQTKIGGTFDQPDSGPLETNQPVAVAPKPDDTGRLPDGSRFNVAYNAEKRLWSGFLDVPGTAGFSGTASGVFNLLGKLDRQYRKSLGS
jgi:hypothetical protein